MSGVLVTDHGDLFAVRNVLRDLDIDFVEEADPECPVYALRIASAATALAPATGSAAPAALATIVVAEQVTSRIETLLHRSDCDFVLKGEFHPMVLRLLVEHLLYDGPVRRRAPRVAISGSVKLRGKWRSKSADLTQLSAMGCGIVTDLDAEVGAPLSVVFPAVLTGAENLELRTSVAGSRELGEGDRALALVFSGLGERERKLVRSMMNASRLGRPIGPDRGGKAKPAAVSRAVRPAPTAAKAAPETLRAEERTDTGDSDERRRRQRRRYDQRVLAGSPEGGRSLIGRDLSINGMRVAANADLALGDEFKIAIYGPRGCAPVVVRARADRDDGAGGFFLRFQAVSDTERLGALVDALPVEASNRSRRGGVVVSERIS